MLFFRMLQHLLPDSAAWRLAAETTLRLFLEGVVVSPEAARGYVDDVYDDLSPTTTRELALWEKQFGLIANVEETARRLNIAAAWAATGGQSPRYLQDVVRAAGFDVYIHEWWSSGPDPWVPRDPRDYTNVPLIGPTQCGEDLAECGEPAAVCNRFLANEPGYLVNKNLTDVAPPLIPSDPAKWPYFIYWGGENFLDVAVIPISRRAEFEALLLKLCPTQHWIVTRVEYSYAFAIDELPLELG